MAIESVAPSWAFSSNLATWLTTLAVLLVVVHRLFCRRYNLPPGPYSWPIIGNFNLISPLPHVALHTLSLKYGPLMHVWLGSKHVTVGSSVEMAKAFLKTHDSIVTSRPKLSADKYTAYNFSDITWSPYGPYWRQARGICKRELFSPKSLESFEYIRREEVHSLMNELFNIATNTKTKNIIKLKRYVSTQGLNIISRMMLGKRFMEKNLFPNIVSPKELSEMMEELFVLNGALNIGDFVPWIDFLDLQGLIKRMKTLSNKFDKLVMENVLNQHIERRKEMNVRNDYVAKDMMDMLLDLAEDPTLEVKLERHGVKAIIQDLIAAGSDTSSTIVEWAISELLKKPEVIKKAIEELEKVIGNNRWIEEKDIVNLPYINAIVKEVMRLHPVAPLLARLTMEHLNINGYDIPKGAQVLVNVWSIARDPTIWDNPNEFIPERFIGKGIDVIGHDLELLPFGAGRRMCPAYSLGLKVVQANLANMLHGFNWSLPHDMKKEELNMEEYFRLSVIKKIPLEIVVEPELPHHLYSL